jgi:hypothetical protein
MKTGAQCLSNDARSDPKATRGRRERVQKARPRHEIALRVADAF